MLRPASAAPHGTAHSTESSLLPSANVSTSSGAIILPIRVPASLGYAVLAMRPLALPLALLLLAAHATEAHQGLLQVQGSACRRAARNAPVPRRLPVPSTDLSTRSVCRPMTGSPSAGCSSCCPAWPAPALPPAAGPAPRPVSMAGQSFFLRMCNVHVARRPAATIPRRSHGPEGLPRSVTRLHADSALCPFPFPQPPSAPTPLPPPKTKCWQPPLHTATEWWPARHAEGGVHPGVVRPAMPPSSPRAHRCMCVRALRTRTLPSSRLPPLQEWDPDLLSWEWPANPEEFSECWAVLRGMQPAAWRPRGRIPWLAKHGWQQRAAT